MAFFVAIVILYFTHVICYLVQTILVSILVLFLIGLTRLSSIDFGGRSEAILLALPLITLAVVFLLFLPSLSGGIRVVRVGRSCRNHQLWIPDLRFFRPGVFCCLGLAVSIARSSVH